MIGRILELHIKKKRILCRFASFCINFSRSKKKLLSFFSLTRNFRTFAADAHCDIKPDAAEGSHRVRLPSPLWRAAVQRGNPLDAAALARAQARLGGAHGRAL